MRFPQHSDTLHIHITSPQSVNTVQCTTISHNNYYLMPDRLQDISWTYDDHVQWPICDVWPGPSELKHCYTGIDKHYSDIIMDTMASQITSLTIVYWSVYSGADQRKHQSSASLTFVRGIHRWPVNSPHKWPVIWKMFPFDHIIMILHKNDNIRYRSQDRLPTPCTAPPPPRQCGGAESPGLLPGSLL